MSSYKDLIQQFEEAVCVRLSEAGYGCRVSMLKSLSIVKDKSDPKSNVEENTSAKCVVATECAATECGKCVGTNELAKCVSLKNLPWCVAKKEGFCSALKKDLGLYTQCKKECSVEYCLGCLKLIERNGGICPYGTVSERLKCGIMEYKDPQGKSPIAFTKIMKKLNISREQVESEGNRLGISIPECHFEEKIENRGRGRPKKDTSADDTASEKSDVETSASVAPISSSEKKKRGRPKKEKEIISNTAGEDLIASLMKDAACTIEPAELEPELEEEEEEEETSVIKFEINGTTYLKSDDHVLYDMDSHEGIGIWNEETKEIENLPTDED